MKSLTEKKAYGQVQLRLKEFMDERNIKRGTLARHIDTRFEVVDHWYKSSVDNIDLDVLARICCALECDISDLLVYRSAEDTNK